METWFLIADENNAALIVRSAYGPVYEIENWKRYGEPSQAFAHRIGQKLATLQGHFDHLALAAPPTLLDDLLVALPASISHRVTVQAPRYLTQLDPRQLRAELAQLCPV